jgi:hypothetical protein
MHKKLYDLDSVIAEYYSITFFKVYLQQMTSPLRKGDRILRKDHTELQSRSGQFFFALPILKGV